MTRRLRHITAVLGIYLSFAIVASVALPFLPSTPAYADVYGALANLVTKGEPAGLAYVADDKPAAIIVKYVGSSTSGKVAVAAGGDLTFTSGAEGSETTDTSFECPISGALGGVIDVSDTACDTLGEVVDTINGSCTGCSSSSWRAVIVDALRSDSSNDTLVTISATAATAATGLTLRWDTSIGLTDTIALTDCRDFTCGYLGNKSIGAPPLIENPWLGTRSVLWQSLRTANYASGTSIYSIHAVTNIKNKVGTTGSETVTQLYSKAAGADDTSATFDFSTFGFFGPKNGKLIIRLTNSVAMDTVTAVDYGIKYPIQ